MKMGNKNPAVEAGFRVLLLIDPDAAFVLHDRKDTVVGEIVENAAEGFSFQKDFIRIFRKGIENFFLAKMSFGIGFRFLKKTGSITSNIYGFKIYIRFSIEF